MKMDNSIAKRQELANKLRTAGCPVNMEGEDWHTAGDLTPPPENTVARFEKREDHTDRVGGMRQTKKQKTRVLFGQTEDFQIGTRVHILQPEPDKPREQWLYSSEVWAIRGINKSKGSAIATPVAPTINGPTPTVEGPMAGPQSPFLKLAIPY